MSTTANLPADRESVVSRALEDLGDDAYRQDGNLSRKEIDDLYIRRGILPDEAVKIEIALKAEGVTIAEDATEDVENIEVPADRKSGSALNNLLSTARLYGRVSALEEIQLGHTIQQGLRISARNDGEYSDIELRVLDRASEARARLIKTNIFLVAKLAFAQRFRSRMDPEDLVQLGLIGLIRACEKFDPNWGTKFSTYAVWWIRQAMGRGIADQSTTIRIPVHMRERVAKYRRTKRVLGLLPDFSSSDIPAVAKSLGWQEDYTARIAQIAEQAVISYDTPINDEGGTIGDFLADEKPNPEELAIAADLAVILGKLVDDLNARQQDIVRRRFGLTGPAQTLQEIGDLYGITRERIRQIESKALRILHSRAKHIGLHRALEHD
ncbi:sigma-70 family RNA polymerase sigma factor [Rhizobium leguminosarum]